VHVRAEWYVGDPVAYRGNRRIMLRPVDFDQPPIERPLPSTGSARTCAADELIALAAV
jgi:hypothetical protein